MAIFKEDHFLKFWRKVPWQRKKPHNPQKRRPHLRGAKNLPLKKQGQKKLQRKQLGKRLEKQLERPPRRQWRKKPLPQKKNPPLKKLHPREQKKLRPREQKKLLPKNPFVKAPPMQQRPTPQRLVLLIKHSKGPLVRSLHRNPFNKLAYNPQLPTSALLSVVLQVAWLAGQSALLLVPVLLRRAMDMVLMSPKNSI